MESVPSEDQRLGVIGLPSLDDRAALVSLENAAKDGPRADGVYYFMNGKGFLAMHK
jgi:hypothetical protein